MYFFIRTWTRRKQIRNKKAQHIRFDASAEQAREGREAKEGSRQDKPREELRTWEGYKVLSKFVHTTEKKNPHPRHV